jgi:pyrimidine deaminase RibD-like protein
MTGDEQYMHRCLQLAQLAAGDVAPNPMVGAVLVHEGKSLERDITNNIAKHMQK